MYGILYMKLSLYYTVWPYDVRSVEMYCCVFLMPAGDLPMTFAALIYADALPAVVNIMDCSMMKKLMWLTRQHRKLSQAAEPNTYDIDVATHGQGLLKHA